MFFILFQFLTRLLTSKHLKLLSTYLVGQNGSMWKTCFLAPQNAKKENQLKHKNQVHNRLFWQLGLREWRIILVITRWAHNSQTFLLIKKNNENCEILCLHVTGYVNTKNSISNYMFCTNDLLKMCASYIFHFSTRYVISTH